MSRERRERGGQEKIASPCAPVDLTKANHPEV